VHSYAYDVETFDIAAVRREIKDVYRKETVRKRNVALFTRNVDRVNCEECLRKMPGNLPRIRNIKAEIMSLGEGQARRARATAKASAQIIDLQKELAELERSKGR
jgi:hypothetical protein